MKKILIIVSMFSVLLALSPTKTDAQVITIGGVSSSVNGATGNSLKLDTVVNTAAKYLVASVAVKSPTVAIQFDCTKISGTVAGTIVPVASNDGVTYYVNGASTMTATDVASQGNIWVVPAGYKYYGVRWTGTGTMSASIKTTIVAYR